MDNRINTKTRSLKVFLVCLTLLLAAACGDAPQGPPVAVHAQGLYVWDSKVWDGPDISVCWKTSGWATEKAWVRDSVNRAWPQRANINFTGWGDCGADPDGITIKIADVGPESYHGTSALSEDPSMTLNFVFNNFRKDDCQGGNEESCIRKIAVHEFGHALAFIHEHQRNDRPPGTYGTGDQNDKWNETGKPATTIGEYDEDSIMTFTYSWFDLAPDKVLSPGDILGVQSVYGRKPQYSLVGIGGKCLDVVGGKVSSGKNLNMYRCNGSLEQRFKVSKYSVKPVSKNLYVGAPMAVPFIPAKLVSGGSHKFQMKKFQLVGLGGLCLTETNGSYVRLKPCDGSASQLWEKYGYGRIKSASANRCMRLVSNLLLGTGSCLGAPNMYLNDGEIRIGSKSSSACMDVSGGYPALQFSYSPYIKKGNCRELDQDYLNQRWHKRGELTLQSTPSMCLDIMGGFTMESIKPQVFPCNGADNQKFDFYF